MSGQVIGAIGNVSAKVGGVAGRALGIQGQSFVLPASTQLMSGVKRRVRGNQ